jgi:transmembrane sensor
MQSDPDEKRLSELEAKWLNGTITPEEAREYAAWYNRDQDATIDIPPSVAGSEEEHREKILGKINRGLQEAAPKSFHFVRLAAAAAVLICLAGAGYWFWSKPHPSNAVRVTTNPANYIGVIVPGKTRATLTLGNGQTIILDTASDGLLARQGGTKVLNKEGSLIYQGAKDAEATQPNTLTTGKGEQYQVTLSDGTKVWLNAASSLKYPARFTGKDRTVELTGEAYFEVKKDQDKPFKVLVSPRRLEVNVLGTSFDIMSYEEEGSIKTTLVDGSVRLTKDQQSIRLSPGQQATLGDNAVAFATADADLEQALAWKNGMFQFDNLDIQTIMRQVARWYDVDVDYQGSTKNQVYSGMIPRKENISELLKFLEYTGTVHFVVEGRKIIVTK